jgi:hypothetical protein
MIYLIPNANLELEQKAAINSGVGKGADVHVQTEVPKPLAHRVLIPGVCWLRASCLSGVCSTGGTDCVGVRTPCTVVRTELPLGQP